MPGINAVAYITAVMGINSAIRPCCATDGSGTTLSHCLEMESANSSKTVFFRSKHCAPSAVPNSLKASLLAVGFSKCPPATRVCRQVRALWLRTDAHSSSSESQWAVQSVMPISSASLEEQCCLLVSTHFLSPAISSLRMEGSQAVAWGSLYVTYPWTGSRLPSLMTSGHERSMLIFQKILGRFESQFIINLGRTLFAMHTACWLYQVLPVMCVILFKANIHTAK